MKKHTNKLWLILAVIGLIGLAFTTCDNGSKPCTHDWQFTSTTATCQDAGEDTFTCKDCQVTKKEARAKLDHIYSETWSKDATNHWKECACGDKTAEAAHSYSGTWSKDATSHWKECACGDKIEEVAHDGDPCTICGYESDHECNYSETWSKDATNHWKECACGDKTAEAAHDWQFTSTTATCQDAGEDTFTCKDCQATKKEPRAELGHDFEGVTPTLISTGVNARTCKNDGCDEKELEFLYKIGDTGPGGGIIFYVETVKPEGFKVEGYTGGTVGAGTDHLNFSEYNAYYLEAAPNNMATIMRWSTQSDSGSYPDVTGTGTIVGTGRKNTALIIAAEIAFAKENTSNPNLSYVYAALAARNYRAPPPYNIFDDWFLPSGSTSNSDDNSELHKLYILYDAKEKGSYGNLTTGTYYSSSQFNNNYARFQNFGTGGRSYRLKYEPSEVRAIRAF